MLDFTKSRLTYKDTDVVRPPTAETNIPSDAASGPTFRHVYHRLIGPTFPGEYVPPKSDDAEAYGLYVLSYPGIAFSFPVRHSAWSPDIDVVNLLSSSAAKPAISMAIFKGESWSHARQSLYTRPVENPRIAQKIKDMCAEEVTLVKIHGQGRLELLRPWAATSYFMTLGETTPQELVAELGPPDAIYRMSDKLFSIHKARSDSESRSRSRTRALGLHDDSTDTDQSSAHTGTDESDEESGDLAERYFYNYFHHGFDILISQSAIPSQQPPSVTKKSKGDEPENTVEIDKTGTLVATKMIIHSNVPGSYPFNRHKRCRWQVQYLSSGKGKKNVHSDISYEEVAKLLREEWASQYSSSEEAAQRQRGMVLNRGWGDSPGSSCELLGGWEDSVGGKRKDTDGANDQDHGLGNTTLYGFPGLVFEVLQNGAVSGLTVF